MSEINTLTVNGKQYDLADAYARQQVSALLGVASSGFLQLYSFDSDAAIAAYLKVNGAIVANERYKCSDYLPVKAGEKIRYKLKMATNAAMLCFYTSPDRDGFVSCVTGTGNVEEGEYTVPEDGYMVACSENLESSVAGYLYKDVTPDLIAAVNRQEREKTDADLQEQVKKIDAVKRDVFSLYGAPYSSAYITNTGKLVENNKYRTTEPVYVKAGVKIRYKLNHGGETPVIALYADSAYTELKDSVLGNGGILEGEYTTPGEGYIRVCELLSHTGGYVCFTDAVPDNVRRYIDNKSLGIHILSLGDSIFGNDGQIVEYLAELTGTNVILGAIGGSRVCIRPYDTDSFRYLDGQNLVQALVTGDWTDQDSAVADLQDTYTWLPDRIATLKALDMSAVDLVIMNWGSNDYTGGHTVEEICAAYGSVIDALQAAYPELRILITTPIWRYFSDTENGDNKVFADATLKQIAEAIENFAKDKRVSVLNAYQNMPLSYNTASTYFDADSDVHLNAKGNMVYAHLLSGKIRSMY